MSLTIQKWSSLTLSFSVHSGRTTFFPIVSLWCKLIFTTTQLVNRNIANFVVHTNSIFHLKWSKQMIGKWFQRCTRSDYKVTGNILTNSEGVWAPEAVKAFSPFTSTHSKVPFYRRRIFSEFHNQTSDFALDINDPSGFLFSLLKFSGFRLFSSFKISTLFSDVAVEKFLNPH